MNNATGIEQGGFGSFPELRDKQLAQGEHVNPIARAMRQVGSRLGMVDEGSTPALIQRLRVSEIVEDIYGLYKATLYSGPIPKVPTVDLTVADLGLTQPGVVWLINRADIKAQRTLLAVGDEVSGVIAGYDKDSFTDIYDCLGVPQPSIFPVTVTKTGGGDGTASTAATWTYTVNSLDGDELGTNVALARPRPVGKRAFGSTFGVAFYSGTTLKLWDAGEVPGTATCP